MAEKRPTTTGSRDVGEGCGEGVLLDPHDLVVAYHAELYRYAYRLTGSVADAEDLTQQAFLVACQKLDQVRDADAARSWLYTVLRNAFLKNRRRRPPMMASDVQLDVEALADPAAEEMVIDQEQLQAAISELPEEFRLVVLMYYFEECSYRQIAETLQLPIGTVMSRLSRAKGHLRARLVNPAELTARRNSLGISLPPPGGGTD